MLLDAWQYRSTGHKIHKCIFCVHNGNTRSSLGHSLAGCSKVLSNFTGGLNTATMSNV